MPKLHLACALFAGTIATGALAQGPDGKARTAAERVKEDIVSHRRLAEVHEAAARCLEQGKTEKTCHDELARACQGVGIGRYCGMRHRH